MTKSKIYTLVFTLLVVLNSCGVFRKIKAFTIHSLPVLKATIANKNVYKTKDVLTVKKVYASNLKLPTNDPRDFALVPNQPITPVTQTTVNVVRTGPVPAVLAVPAGPLGNPPAIVGVAAIPAQEKTTTTTTTIPPTTTTTTVIKVTPAAAPPATGTTTRSSITTYNIPASPLSHDFLRYKVLSEDDNYKYIKLLPRCIFSDTSIIIYTPIAAATAAAARAAAIVAGAAPIAPPNDFPEAYVFQVSKKNLVPNNHYLASSAIIGKITTIPVIVRKDYWNENNKTLQANLSLGYSFGWKFKLGNNPYSTSYISAIFYGAGISQQKYFSVVGKYTNGKDSTSAKTDQLAVTYLSFGLSYEFEKFNIGIFAGKDKMFGSLRDWAYQDKWWWGIGIGYDLFK